MKLFQIIAGTLSIHEEENFGHYSSFLVLNSARAENFNGEKIMQLYKEGFTADWDFSKGWETVDSDFLMLQDMEVRSSSLLSSKSNTCKNTMVFSKKVNLYWNYFHCNYFFCNV